MLVPAKRYDEVKALVQAAIAKFTLGPSLDENTRLGPLVSAAQRERVLGFIRQGLEEGAELVAGGADKPAFDSGYFVQPTVLRVQPNDTLAREEIFGPVLVILTYEDEEEAIRIANDTIYGLGGGVWSVDLDHAMAVARQIRTGQVDITVRHLTATPPLVATNNRAMAVKTASMVLRSSWSSKPFNSSLPTNPDLFHLIRCILC